MPLSMDSVICPYCGARHSKSCAIGNSGLINCFGTKKTMTCDKCKKDFGCTVDVTIKYKTKKIAD